MADSTPKGFGWAILRLNLVEKGVSVWDSKIFEKIPPLWKRAPKGVDWAQSPRGPPPKNHQSEGGQKQDASNALLLGVENPWPAACGLEEC